MTAFERCFHCGMLGLLLFRDGELEPHRPPQGGDICPNRKPTATLLEEHAMERQTKQQHQHAAVFDIALSVVRDLCLPTIQEQVVCNAIARKVVAGLPGIEAAGAVEIP